MIYPEPRELPPDKRLDPTSCPFPQTLFPPLSSLSSQVHSHQKPRCTFPGTSPSLSQTRKKQSKTQQDHLHHVLRNSSHRPALLPRGNYPGTAPSSPSRRPPPPWPASRKPSRPKIRPASPESGCASLCEQEVKEWMEWDLFGRGVGGDGIDITARDTHGVLHGDARRTMKVSYMGSRVGDLGFVLGAWSCGHENGHDDNDNEQCTAQIFQLILHHMH